ncbi:MAG TPA: PDZ domain-containing protein [Planctomycetota bacterium]|nr:PDZ domain-containing protein [Planctomycetota bacterium]HRR80995.1 PDZ domain-containing protein [Planctomycetota bacterium]HRT93647.1 PDZ domain-containing protein [Planctomycetota bacterium]
MRSRVILWALVIGAGAIVVGGCSGDSGSLRGEVSALQQENQQLREQVEKLSAELRPLRAKVDELDVGQRRLEGTLANARKDLEARVTDMVQQEVSGRRGERRFMPVAPPPARFEEKPYMGFDGQDIEPDVAKLLNLKTKTGVLVTDVREGSPAAVAGVAKNDVIVGIGDAEIKSFQNLKEALEGKKPNDVLTLTVLRGDEKLAVKITLGARRVRVDE